MKEFSFDADHLAAVTSMRVETPYPLRHPPNTESAPAKKQTPERMCSTQISPERCSIGSGTKWLEEAMTHRDLDKAGHIRVIVHGKCHTAAWRVVGSTILVTSPFGEGTAFLGALATAPATAACEKLKEMVAAQPNRQRQLSPKSSTWTAAQRKREYRPDGPEAHKAQIVQAISPVR